MENTNKATYCDGRLIGECLFERCAQCQEAYYQGQSEFDECGCEHTNGTVYLCLAHQPNDQGTTPVWADGGF